VTEMTWGPSLLVLAAGLAIGAWLALRFRREAVEREAADADLLLRIRDLEERRDDLYRRLRAADEDNLGMTERESLVDAAARTLMELDRLQQRVPRASAVAPAAVPGTRQEDQVERVAEGRPTAAADGSPRRGHPLAAGILIGAAMVAVVALLVYFAVRDAQPTGSQTIVQAAPGTPDDPHSGQSANLPPELAEQVADLQARIVDNPEDWAARKQLSLILLASGRFFEAFTLAGEVLQRFPDDPDALLVHGIVRVSMGQFDVGKELLERVLASHPDHQQALLYRGLALYQLGQTEQAIDTWQIGLELAGGRDPDLEELLAMAEAGLPLGGSGSQPAASASPPPSSSASSTLAAGAYGVLLDLAAGTSPPAGATLFVFLREAEGGPPIAVTRLVAPTFPLQISLSAADSMMGDEELPASGMLVARLDADGSVTTTGPDDLQAEVEASSGEWTTLTLGR
jgi:tetratricopeptide (TPR) repeat protein